MAACPQPRYWNIVAQSTQERLFVETMLTSNECLLSYRIQLHCFYLKKTVFHSKLGLCPIKWFYSRCRNPELCICQELFVTQQLGEEEDSYSKNTRNISQDAQITLSNRYG